MALDLVDDEAQDDRGISIEYDPEPTAARFHACDDFVRGIMGPVGTGKSVTCSMEMFIRACQQRPYRGTRKSRWAAMRNSYPELKTTTIKTFQDWFPPDVCTIKWDVPITAHIQMNLDDGTRLDMEVLFLALDRPQDVKKLKSLELTGAWMNEAGEMDRAVLDMLTSRVGRFPSKREGGPSWTGIIMDTNPPSDDSWYYHLAEEEKPEQVIDIPGEERRVVRYTFFRQPPALIPSADGLSYLPNPEAENVKHHALGYGYWYQQIAGKSREWIKVFVEGSYGSVNDGRPVYAEFRDDFHVSATPLEPMRGLPIFLGWDFGLTPAVIVGQVTPRGQLRILDELCSENQGIKQFANDVVKPYLANHFLGFVVRSVGDPMGNRRAENDREQTCFRELELAGIPTIPARSNDFLTRREAVAGYLNRVSDGEPALLLDPRCKVLRRGFNGAYCYRRILVSTARDGIRYKDEPEDSPYTHPHDGLQYLCLLLTEPAKVKNAAQKRPVRPRSAAGWT